MDVWLINDWMAWTQTEYDVGPVLTVHGDAPDEQKCFAKDFARMGTHRVIIEGEQPLDFRTERR